MSNNIPVIRYNPFDIVSVERITQDNTDYVQIKDYVFGELGWLHVGEGPVGLVYGRTFKVGFVEHDGYRSGFLEEELRDLRTGKLVEYVREEGLLEGDVVHLLNGDKLKEFPQVLDFILGLKTYLRRGEYIIDREELPEHTVRFVVVDSDSDVLTHLQTNYFDVYASKYSNLKMCVPHPVRFTYMGEKTQGLVFQEHLEYSGVYVTEKCLYPVIGKVTDFPEGLDWAREIVKNTLNPREMYQSAVTNKLDVQAKPEERHVGEGVVIKTEVFYRDGPSDIRVLLRLDTPAHLRGVDMNAQIFKISSCCDEYSAQEIVIGNEFHVYFKDEKIVFEPQPSTKIAVNVPQWMRKYCGRVKVMENLRGYIIAEFQAPFFKYTMFLPIHRFSKECVIEKLRGAGFEPQYAGKTDTSDYQPLWFNREKEVIEYYESGKKKEAPVELLIYPRMMQDIETRTVFMDDSCIVLNPGELLEYVHENMKEQEREVEL